MNKQKTVSLQLAKELQKAGVEMECEHLYHLETRENVLFNTEGGTIEFDMNEFIPAPDTNELLEFLPYGTIALRTERGKYVADELGIYIEPDYKNFNSDTPQEALAKLAIYLKTNNLLDKSINKK